MADMRHLHDRRTTAPGPDPAPGGQPARGQPLRIWIVEDESSFREMLADYLGALPGIRLVGASGDHGQLMVEARAGQVDLVVLDLNLGEIGGITVMRKLAALASPPGVLILTAHASAHAVLLAEQLDARGLVEKTAPLSTLEAALRQIAAGGIYFSDGPRRLLDQMAVSRDARVVADRVSRREIQLLLALLSGISIEEAASQLGMSLSAAYQMRRQLMQKTAARNTRELQNYAHRIGLGGTEATQPFVRPRKPANLPTVTVRHPDRTKLRRTAPKLP